MNIKKILFLVTMILFLANSIFAKQIDEEFVYGFLTGKYILIGKKIDSNETYTGRIELIFNESGKRLQFIRTIKGKITKGTVKIEYATSDKLPVLKFYFKENGIDYEGAFLWMSDLDNFGRISGYIYQPGKNSSNPGLEAYFIENE